MKNWFSKLNISYKTAFVSLIVTLLCFGLTFPLIIIDLVEISLGITLGGLFGSLGYYLFGLIESKSNEKLSMALTIIIVFAKFLILAVILFITGMIYYKYDLHLFNVFATAGGYLISLIAYIIFNLKGGKLKDGTIQ